MPKKSKDPYGLKTFVSDKKITYSKVPKVKTTRVFYPLFGYGKLIGNKIIFDSGMVLIK